MNNQEVTQLLKNLNQGDSEAKDMLYESVYTELKKTAKSVRKRYNDAHTMNTTALVHEAYLKLVPESIEWQNRLHFYYIAGKVMRQILYNYAEKKMALKRGGKKALVDVDDVKEFIPLDDQSFFEIYCLENVLKKLEEEDKVYGDIVECRFYSAMTIEETAQALNISEATVKRKWNFAKAWLLKEMKDSSSL